MREFQISGKKRLCFVVKKGEAKTIVVPYDNLSDIDLKRFFDMEKNGGELMRVMRDTTLDNGVNALVMYADMLLDVDNELAEEPAKKPSKKTEVKVEDDEPDKKPSNKTEVKVEDDEPEDDEVTEKEEETVAERKSKSRKKDKK